LVHYLLFLLLGGIGDFQFKHEPVHLGLRQRIRPLLLYRVLRGKHEERLVEHEAFLADGHLALLHRLEKRALHLCGRSVYLVREYQVREERPLLHGELPVLGVVHLGAHQVGRQQVGRELYPLEFRFYAFAEDAHGRRLRQPRNSFEQDVAVGKQADEQALDHVLLAHNHL